MSVNIKESMDLEAPIENESKGKGLNTFVLLFVIVFISAILTYIIPSGSFDRVEVDGRTVVQDGTFQYIESNPVGLFGLVTSIPIGMIEAAAVIFFVLLMGGYFGILRATGAIDALILLLTNKLGNHEKLIIPILVFFFALIAALTGAAEANLVYIPILVPLVLALGFDTITALGIILVGASAGFTAAVMNPFTVGVAQEIAELPIFSGMGLRLTLFIVLYTFVIYFIYRHAMKVKNNPKLGIYGKYDPKNSVKKITIESKMSNRHKLVLFFFFLNFVILVYGVLKFNWFIQDLAGLFFLFCIIIGLAGKLKPSNIAENFVIGSKELLEAALIIGVARAILVVLNDGQIMDTILYHAGNIVGSIPSSFTALGMFVFQMILDFFVPSGSGKAALSMPIMVPLADLVGVTRQTAVLAYQFGDGITNLVFPTSSFLMAALAMTGIGYAKWLKWVFPFIAFQVISAMIALIIAQYIQYGPF